MAFADFFMPVLAAAQGILAVVNMNGLQPLQSDKAVKLLQHLIQALRNVIAAVKYVARIQADAYLIRKLHLVDNSRQLFKAAAYFRPLAGHGFQQHRRPLS